MSATAQKASASAIFLLIALIGSITGLYLEGINTRMDHLSDSIVRVEIAVVEERMTLAEVLVAYEHRFTLLEAQTE